jgi:cysteine desulfurase family protein (TIGR01976 family)
MQLMESSIMNFDVETLRAQFPSVRDNKAVFFDNPAGTQVSERVITAVRDYYLHANANSGGAFLTSQRNDELTHAARTWMADFLNAPQVDEVVFGPNMTTLNFGLSRAIAQTLSSGDEIILTRMDHDANVAPWLRIAEDKKLTVKWIDINPADGTLDLASYEAALSERTRLVATVHASNALGTINPIRQIAEMAHEAGALHVVDAVQSAPHIPIDVQALGCDFLLCSAYKFFGPHIGIMWGRYDLLAKLPAYKVRPSKDKPPYRWETGTPSYETIHATGQAIAYLHEIGTQYGTAYADQFSHMTDRRQVIHAGMAALQAYERDLVTHLVDSLEAIGGVQIFGVTDRSRFEERVPTVVFTMRDHTPQEIAAHLAEHHIYVWDGDYYAVEVMERLGHGENGMVRVGLAHYNTHEEVDRFAAAMRQI